MHRPRTVRARCEVLLFVVALVTTACADAKPGFRPLQAGDRAPTYAAATLAGDSVSLTALRGQAVLLNVWATWCIPCRKEMPALQQLHTLFAGSGLRILAISVDSQGAERDVKTFLDSNGLTFTVALDPARSVQRVFRTIGVPETFLINRDGRLVKRWIGEIEPMSDEVKGAVRTALGPLQ